MSHRDRSPADRGKFIYLHVGNIPFSKSWSDVKDFVKKECGNCGFVDIAMNGNRSAGYGRIGLRNRQEALTIIDKVNGKDMDGRKLMVRFETENDRRKWPDESEEDDYGPPHIPAPYITSDMLESIGFKGPVSDSVFVKNVSESATWKALREKFDYAGPVQFVDLIKGKKSDGFYFALARFKHGFEALLCIAMFDRDIFQGREIRIRMDKQGTQMGPNEPIFPNTRIGSLAAQKFLSEMQRRATSRDPIEAGFAAKAVAMVMSQMRRSGPQQPPLPPPGRIMPLMPSPRRSMHMEDYFERDRGFPQPMPPADGIRMRPLDPPDYDDRRPSIRSLYPPRPGMHPDDMRPLPPMPHGRPHGPPRPPPHQGGPGCYSPERPYGPPQMQQGPGPSQGQDSAKSNGAIIKLISAAIQGGISPDKLNSYAKDLGLSEKQLEDIKISSKNGNTNMSSRILVRNLPFEFNESEMEVYFAPYGRIKDLSISADGQGRSLGYGYVEYYSPKDAAISLNRLNGIRIGDQTIKLDYD